MNHCRFRRMDTKGGSGQYGVLFIAYLTDKTNKCENGLEEFEVENSLMYRFLKALYIRKVKRCCLIHILHVLY